ncbi:MAG: diguanylate cyclase [Oscillospiraceae bacterium]|jgi:PleD family two-component response regulator|nr:diguanylate cyclase [Oscillospiraceae bacterium]
MKKNILIISDSGNFHYVTEAIFKERYTVFMSETEKDAFSVLAASPISLIIMTASIKAGTKQQDGFKFLERLRSSGKRFSDTPVILVAPLIAPVIISKAHEYNVSELIQLPFDPIAYDEKVGEVLFKFSPARERPDPVTGLPKKYAGEQSIAALLESGRKGALMLIDLDHYSFVCTGISEKTLLTCRNIIQEEIDEKAVLAVLKAGGFLLFVPELREREKVQNYAARLIKKILERVESEKVYVSIGLAVSERHGKNYEDLYLACDKGLGEARKHGKNLAKFYSW